MIAMSTAAGSTVGIVLGKKLGIKKSSLTQPTRKRPTDTTVPILERDDDNFDPPWLNRGRRGVRSLLAVGAPSPNFCVV